MKWFQSVHLQEILSPSAGKKNQLKFILWVCGQTDAHGCDEEKWDGAGR